MARKYCSNNVDTSSKLKRGFKAVRTYENKNYPVASLILGIRKLEYIPYKPTYRPIGNGPLSVFENKHDAISFIKSYKGRKTNLKLFKCKYLPSIDKNLWDRNLWFKHTMIVPYEVLPKGTFLADVVVITKEVKET